jgi:hypothetical protein
MKKASQRKLKLVQDTIRVLAGGQLANINGGALCAAQDSAGGRCSQVHVGCGFFLTVQTKG